jgi:2-polyprenyl-6-methoxyphenol hydroxylase-like FAD-dependent oxidoreductase
MAGVDGGGFRFYDRHLRTLAVLDGDLLTGGVADEVARHRSVSRIRLREVLLRELGPAVLHEGREFTRYEHTAAGDVRACFADGGCAVGDLLIGADGSNSRVRGQYLPELRRFDTGALSIAGRYPLTDDSAAKLPPELCTGAANVIPPRSDWMFVAAWRPPASASGSDAGSVVALDADAYVLWAYVAGRQSLPADVEQWGGAALRELALTRTDGWAAGLRTLVAGADPATVSTVRLRSMPKLTGWPASNVTLLGDAVHNMTPMAGIGANTALRDAAVLRRVLVEVAAGRRELVAAVAEYEEEMRGYANKAVGLSLDNARRAVSDARLPRVAFRTVLRAAQAVPPLKRAMFAGMGS